MLTFVTGPVRSGKSTLAERLAVASGRPVTYLATSVQDYDDPEWRGRLEKHRAQRPGDWTVVETAGRLGTDLIAAVAGAQRDRCLLVDSLGTWVADLLGRHAQTRGDDVMSLMRETEVEVVRFTDAAARCAAELIVVGDEVGWGVVPAAASGRVFRDVIGRAHQRLTSAAGRAYLVTCGVAIDLKANAQTLDAIVAEVR